VPTSPTEIGDYVQVYGTGASGLPVRSPSAGDSPLPGVDRFDGNQGRVIDGPQSCNLDGKNYTLWKIQWSDCVSGWSAQDWLTKIPLSTHLCGELHISRNPTSGGTVTANPARSMFADAEMATLTATANQGYFFHSWSGVDNPSVNPAHVTMSGPRSVTANFTLTQANTSCGCPVQYLSQCYGGARISTQSRSLTTHGIAKTGPEDAIDLALIRRFRDEVLAATLQGRSIIENFDKHSLELLHHFLADTNVQSVAKQAIISLQPVMQDLIAGAGDLLVSTNQINALNALIGKLNEVAGVELKSAIQEQLDHVGGTLTNLTGNTSIKARRFVLGIPIRIVNPKITRNGGFEFTATGELSGTLRVESSDDLTAWTALDLAPVLQLPAVLRDDRPLSAKQRYYRVIVAPQLNPKHSVNPNRRNIGANMKNNLRNVGPSLCSCMTS